MKRRILYWVPTGLLVLMMGFGGIMDLIAGPDVLVVMRHLGYPDYFARVLGVAKILGVIAILAPVPRWVREWAYAGFTFDLIAAGISHLAAGDPVTAVIPPVLGLVFVAGSYMGWRARLAEQDGTAAKPSLVA